MMAYKIRAQREVKFSGEEKTSLIVSVTDNSRRVLCTVKCESDDYEAAEIVMDSILAMLHHVENPQEPGEDNNNAS